MRRFLLLLPFLAIAGCVAAGGPRPAMTRHHAGSLFQVSDSGMFGVELLFPDNRNVLRTGENRVEVVVHDRWNREVRNARVSLEPWMPMQRVGSPQPPMVSEEGGGRYAVSGVAIPREGHWQLRVSISSGMSRDTVVFDFPGMRGLPGAAEAGASVAEEPVDDAGPDTANIRISEQNAFMVSYESASETLSPVAANAWLLTVKALDGSPVPVAVIKVDVRMPEQGRSLPSRPQVTENLGGGIYRVQGFTFEEPGWWEVRFTIKAMGREDAAVFNLIVP